MTSQGNITGSMRYNHHVFAVFHCSFVTFSYRSRERHHVSCHRIGEHASHREMISNNLERSFVFPLFVINGILSFIGCVNHRKRLGVCLGIFRVGTGAVGFHEQSRDLPFGETLFDAHGYGFVVALFQRRIGNDTRCMDTTEKRRGIDMFRSCLWLLLDASGNAFRVSDARVNVRIVRTDRLDQGKGRESIPTDPYVLVLRRLLCHG
eukprot:scaffold8050_cov180-Amphora_coffeaeformis.AAC.6